jgi:hypothetical protein
MSPSLPGLMYVTDICVRAQENRNVGRCGAMEWLTAAKSVTLGGEKASREAGHRYPEGYMRTHCTTLYDTVTKRLTILFFLRGTLQGREGRKPARAASRRERGKQAEETTTLETSPQRRLPQRGSQATPTERGRREERAPKAARGLGKPPRPPPQSAEEPTDGALKPPDATGTLLSNTKRRPQTGKKQKKQNESQGTKKTPTKNRPTSRISIHAQRD